MPVYRLVPWFLDISIPAAGVAGDRSARRLPIAQLRLAQPAAPRHLLTGEVVMRAALREANPALNTYVGTPFVDSAGLGCSPDPLKATVDGMLRLRLARFPA